MRGHGRCLQRADSAYTTAYSMVWCDICKTVCEWKFGLRKLRGGDDITPTCFWEYSMQRSLDPLLVTPFARHSRDMGNMLSGVSMSNGENTAKRPWNLFLYPDSLYSIKYYFPVLKDSMRGKGEFDHCEWTELKLPTWKTRKF
jgi:hypothetical protein